MRGVFLVLGLALLLALSALRLADPWPVQALREAGFDGMQRLAPRGVTPDLPVQVVQIDAGTLADLGPWPWPRDLLARLVERLGALGASVVVLDMPLAEPDRLSPARMAEAFRDAGLLSPLANAPQLAALDSDLALVRGLGTVPVVLGLELGDTPGAPPPRVSVTEAGDTPMAAIRPLTGAVAPLPVTLTAAAGLGVMTVAPDATAGVVRRVQVLWRTPDGALMPSLEIEALRLGLGQPEVVLRAAGGAPGVPDTLRLGDIVLPVTPQGEVWLHYRPLAADTPVSARAVLAQGDDPDLRARLEGRIVL
ncbi:MAG TPA: CHASE2 domain-containing protein, partial [Paracoccaceae bacterium]|nr:CHASE2 domain-containing protein [Paracoccaceae bacterium]